MKKELEIFNDLHRSLSNGLRIGRAEKPREWVNNNFIDVVKSNVCYNSGQIHHGKSQDFIDELVSINYLKQSTVVSNTGKHGYTCFAKESIVFPLKDKLGNVVNFYAIQYLKDEDKSEYLNTNGIYPSYPHSDTKTLYISRSIVDAAIVLSNNILKENEAIISLHEGQMLDQHFDIINQLKQLKTILMM